MAFNMASTLERIRVDTKKDVDPIIHLWIMRILVPLSGYRQIMKVHDYNDVALADIIGLGCWFEDTIGDFDWKVIRSELGLLHQKAEKQWAKASLPACLRNNIERLSNLMGLSATDCRILEFAVLIHDDQLLNETADRLGAISTVKVFHALSQLVISHIRILQKCAFNIGTPSGR